jgi:hypothetical protein
MKEKYTKGDPFEGINAYLVELNIRYSEFPHPSTRLSCFDPSIVVTDPAACRKGGLLTDADMV